MHYHLALSEFYSLQELNSEVSSNSCSSRCTSYMGSPSSLPSRRVHRNVSFHSLQKKFNGLQHYHHFDRPLSSESSLITEEMSRTSPYSPEEKRVRIERYRRKRSQRNFGKKIKYACRKTLADNRPRIRGRFARNVEIATNPPVQWRDHMSTGKEEDEEGENWANFFDSLAPANLAQDPQGS